MKSRISVFLTLCLGLILSPASFARVIVNTGGVSNGTSLTSRDGPKNINISAKSSASGGSIVDARAKSRFTAKQVKHGNRVVARNNIAGDEEPTHVDGNSIFAGIATFIADVEGASVPNFTIGLTVDGALRCKAAAPGNSPGFAIAGVECNLVVDGVTRFDGAAVQDGNGAFNATGPFAGTFAISPNAAQLASREFQINLGTLTDGQKVPFLFVGSTLVSFGADVPVEFASANFFNTSTFRVIDGQAGQLKIASKAGRVKVAFVRTGSNPSTFALYIESRDDSIIRDIKPGSVKIVVPTVGFFGGQSSLFAVTAGVPGDIDSDGVTDVVLDPINPGAENIILSSNTVIVYGVTNAGAPFLGTLKLR